MTQCFCARDANSKPIYRQAHAEATYALDYVSLALSKFAPRQAEMSMSQYLKFKIPQGSLDIDRVSAPEETEAQKSDIKAVSRGWTLESFDSSADKLLQAATRLEEEVAAETKYWSEILAVKEKGWKICRLPQERQTLGVQFGFLEGKFVVNLTSPFLLSSLMENLQLQIHSVIVGWPR